MIFLNKITQWNCIQTQIFISVILFLAEKRWYGNESLGLV